MLYAIPRLTFEDPLPTTGAEVIEEVVEEVVEEVLGVEEESSLMVEAVASARFTDIVEVIDPRSSQDSENAGLVLPRNTKHNTQ